MQCQNVSSGTRVKLASCKNALNPPVVYSTDRSKVVVLVLVLLFVALWFILRGDLFYVLPYIILFLCVSVLLALQLPHLGKRELILVLFVCLFDLCLFGFFCFLFLLVSGKGCNLWLWHSLDFSLTFFFFFFFSSSIWGQQRSRSACTFMQSDQCLHCPLTESLDSTECVNGEQRPRWYFAQTQDDLNLLILHIWRHFFTCHCSYVISSPEHEVLKVSYCGQSMSILRRAASRIALEAYTSYTLGPIDLKLSRRHGNDLQIKNR